MHFRPPFIAEKPRKRFFERFGKIAYPVLSVALGTFLLWIWFSPKREKPPVIRPATVRSNAPVAVVAPIRRIEPPPSGARPVETVLEAQIALVRLGISPGSIDGVAGSQTRSALMAFQTKNGLNPSGLLDSETKSSLLLTFPAMTDYTVTSNDLARLMIVPKTWLEKSEQPRLDFESMVELLGEKAFSHPQLIRALNPNIHWNALTAGATVTIPRVEYPPVAARAAWVNISLQRCVLEAFDDESNLLVHFPCSIGRLVEKRPAGELHVITVAFDPDYTFDPAVFPESSEAQAVGRKLIIPPGPNNPVGVAWIGLDRPGYGIHGTPAPEQVGRTESHGCFRLANWNAEYLAKLVWVGMKVRVE